MNGVTLDLTERKRAEDRQLLLAREVDHRAKNMLGRRALRAAAHQGEIHARLHLDGGGPHPRAGGDPQPLSATRWQGAELRRIVEEELAPYRSEQADRVATDGPSAMLLPATAQAVALAPPRTRHNAAKYGALSVAPGRLRVSWSIGQAALELDWIEAGGPPADRTFGAGFWPQHRARPASRAQFHGGVRYDWRPEGLHCHLSIPRAQIVNAEPEQPLAPCLQGRAIRQPARAGPAADC